MLELLLSLQGVVGWLGFGVPFCLGLVGLSGFMPASFPVGASGVVLALLVVGTGGIALGSFSVGAGVVILGSLCVDAGCTLLASFSVGVQVLSRDPSSVGSIKSPPTLLSSCYFLFPLVDGVGSRSILLLSGDGGGSDIPWLVGSIPWLAGGSDGEMVQSWLALLRSFSPG